MHPHLRANFEALSTDAAIWDDASSELAAAATDIESINIYRGAFSFAGMEVADRYAELQTLVVQLLREGALNTSAGADALLAIRADFERLEDVSQSEFYALWQPIE